MLRTIKFYGSLADQFGHEDIKVDVNTPAMLMRGLEFYNKDFNKHLPEYTKLGFICTKNDGEAREVVKSESYHQPFGDADTIHMVPEVEGNYVIDEIAAYLAVSYAVAAVIVVVAYVALLVAVAEVAQALAPKPSAGSSAAENQSFIFSGPHNTANQGGPLPIIYGTCLVGSTVIASDEQTLDIAVGSTANITGRFGGHF